jgi:glycosyltransferase involved in cell wall biosynthesis
LFGLRKTLNVCRKNCPELVHSQELFPGWVGHFVKKKYKIPHVLVKEMASNYPGLHGRTVLLAERLSLPLLNFDVLVSWSRFMVEEFFEHWGIQKKIKIIPGGIRLEYLPDRVKREKIRKKYGISKENLLVITKPLYRANAYAISYVVTAMLHLLKECPNSELVIAGEGQYRPYLESLVKKLNLTDNVRLLGSVSHKEALRLQVAADVLPHSFIYEPTTSIALLEAMASGTPVVCTSSGEAKYLVSNCGILVPPRDPEAMAAGIMKLLKDKKLAETLSKKARRRVEKKYRIKKVADRYLKLYDELL